MLPLLLLLILLPFGEAQGEKQPPKEVEYRGRYVNADYRFSVQIPKGLVGLGAAEHAPNHGFRIAFPGNVDFSDCIIVYAEYDVMEAEDRESSKAGKYEPEGFHVLEERKTKTKLSEANSEQSYQRLKRKSDGVLFVWLDVWLERKVQGSPVIYSLRLRTPERYFANRSEIFNSLKGSFRLLP